MSFNLTTMPHKQTNVDKSFNGAPQDFVSHATHQVTHQSYMGTIEGCDAALLLTCFAELSLSSTEFLETMLLDACPCRSTVHAHHLPRHIVALPYLTTTAWSCLSCLGCQDSMHVTDIRVCTCPSGASNVQCLPFCTVQDGSQQAALSLGQPEFVIVGACQCT